VARLADQIRTLSARRTKEECLDCQLAAAGLVPMSIVINSHNEGLRLKATVEALRRNVRGQDFELIVIDDGSTDKSAEDLGEDICIVRNAQRIGCGLCKGQGVEAGQGSVFGFFDAHCNVVDGRLADLAVLAARERAIICPIVRNVQFDEDWNFRPPSATYLWPSGNGLRREKQQYQAVAKVSTKPHRLVEVDMITVGCFMSRETLEALGGWNNYEGLHGSQERGMALRAFMAKIPIKVFTGVQVGHQFRKGKWPYKPPPRKHQLRNLWHAFGVVASPETFEAHFRKYLTRGNGGLGRHVLGTKAFKRDRDHFQAHCKKRSDRELLEKLDLVDSPSPNPKPRARSSIPLAPHPKPQAPNPQLPGIDVRICYEPGGRLGFAYNRAIRNSWADWVLLLDHDVLLLNPNWYEICQRVIKEHPRAGMFTCWTNNIGCKKQKLKEAPRGHDLKKHREKAREIWERFGLQTTQLRRQLIGGFLMLVRKSAWKKIGGFVETGFFGVDNDFHHCLHKAGLEVWRMDGLYCYHLRERKDRTWLKGTCLASAHELKRTPEELRRSTLTPNPQHPSPRVVYTVVTGRYDRLPKVPAFPGWDYVAFVAEDSLEFAGEREPWQIRTLDTRGLDPIRASRLPKILPQFYLPQYEYSLYCDANQRLRQDPTRMGEKARWPDWIMSRHPNRSCVYEEAKSCVRMSKASIMAVETQIQRYRDAGMPENLGLTANGIMLRRHKAPAVIEFAKRWWEEYAAAETSRDQLALPFVLWKHGFEIRTFSVTERNRFFRRKNHARG